MPKKWAELPLGVMIVASGLLLAGCKEKLSWQEQLCVDAIKLKARYGYDIHEVHSKRNKLLKNVMDVTGQVTVDDGFGKKTRQSFRCSISDELEDTEYPEQVRAWIY